MSRESVLEIEPLSQVLGARIAGLDLRTEHDAQSKAAMRDLLARYHVLCVSGQDIDAEDQIRFANMFGKANAEFIGKPERAEYPNAEDGPEKRGILFISNVRENGKEIGALPDGELHFHSDGAHRNKPYRATTLYSIKIPSTGGETRFANMAMAWDALPDQMKKKLEGLKVHNVYDTRALKREQTNPSDDHLSNAIHPLVRTHADSGRKSLYLSRLMTRAIVGMDQDESDALLNELFVHIERPEFIYEHKWSLGDLLIWDNRSVNHARADFPANEIRHMRRVTVQDVD